MLGLNAAMVAMAYAAMEAAVDELVVVDARQLTISRQLVCTAP